jgi:hypothetical protein
MHLCIVSLPGSLTERAMPETALPADLAKEIINE